MKLFIFSNSIVIEVSTEKEQFAVKMLLSEYDVEYVNFHSDEGFNIRVYGEKQILYLVIGELSMSFDKISLY